ncbi:MAG TPA: DMT family transporter [Oscillatoriaceae cyanobacterium M33_DOE_052]|nr:DMT family transporter [Oscillatoriaceae cyanobacterium M33_DOE_052]
MNESPMSVQAVGITLGICALFGGAQVAVKVALGGFTPLFCGALAFTMSTVGLWVYGYLRGERLQLPSRQVLPLHLISAFLFVLFNGTALMGQQLTLASRASIFLASHPFFVVLFNYFTPRRQRLNGGVLMGLGLAFAGEVVVFGDKLAASSGASWLGDGLMMVASALLGLIIIYLRTVTNYVSTIEAVWWQSVLSVPFFWLGAWLWESPLLIPAGFAPWWALVYLSVGVNAIAFATRAELFRRYNANSISSFMTISPVMGVILAHLLLGDPLNWGVGVGGAVVFAGVLLVYRYS